MKRVIVFFLFPLLAAAEPGPVTQYLKSEPATLFDIGMMRLKMLTTDFESHVGLTWTEDGKSRLFRADVNSGYEPDKDKIIVSFIVMNSKATEAQMAEGCRNAMTQMNISLMKSMPLLFSHVGQDDSGRPPDFFAGLKDMFEIRCYISGHRAGEGRFWASRSLGTLGDDEMRIGKWEMSN